jgi:hypothetical protein
MELATARRHIQTCLERMRSAYLKPVFDEWAVLSLPGKLPGVIAYSGPRAETFLHNLTDDAEPLRARAAGREFAEGDIEFAPDATGTRYDAFVKIGPISYLVLNHSTKTMTEIRADAKWLLAQPALFELTEKFRADPLET